jgi:uncharacterized membrane protein
MSGKNYFTANKVAGISILLAIVVVLQGWLSTISFGVVQLNFTLIPIVLGALLYGSIAGGILGLACGVVVMVQVMMGLSPFYTVIWMHTPVVAALTCIVKTTVAGLVSGWIYRCIRIKPLVRVFLASAAAPVLNTALFIVGCLFMNESIVAFQNGIPEFAGVNIFVFILVGLVTSNFFIELAVNLIFAPTLHRVLTVVGRTLKR